VSATTRGANDPGSLIGPIYDAAFDERLWVPVMNRMADLVGGGSTILIRKNLNTGQGRGVFGRVDETRFNAYFGRFARNNPLADAVAHMSAGSFLIDWQVLSKDKLIRSEYYNEFLQPLGIHSVLGLMIWRHGPEVAIINLTRSLRRGEYQTDDTSSLKALMPHLRRAVRLARQVNPGVADGQWAGAGIEACRDATVLLDGDARVLHANALAQDILDRRDGLSIAGGRLTARDPAIAQRLRDVASAPVERPNGLRGDTLVVSRPDGRRPYLVTVVPARRGHGALFPNPVSVIVTMTDLDRKHRPDREIVQAAFGLSRAQANVAVLFAAGQTGREIAAALGISQFTVRRHLADIMERTNVRRQAELARLLLRIPDEFDGGSGLLH
jgi:DNA-binding CsgD family transcriptional regulator